MKRRDFLKTMTLGVATVLLPFRSRAQRLPYVRLNDSVDCIGRKSNRPEWSWSFIVLSVGEWDGKGYPVSALPEGHYGAVSPVELYDIDLACISREIPNDFWSKYGGLYPNVHTYLRCKRFGETVEQAIRNLGFANVEEDVARYARRATLVIKS